MWHLLRQSSPRLSEPVWRMLKAAATMGLGCGSGNSLLCDFSGHEGPAVVDFVLPKHASYVLLAKGPEFFR